MNWPTEEELNTLYIEWDWYAKDSNGTWTVFEVKPHLNHYDVDNEWLSLNSNYHGISRINLINHLNELTKDKPWNECIIKKPGATE
jgi:hypothetical protein